MKKKNNESTPTHTIFGKDSEFEGNMKFTGSIMIEGAFKGNISGKGTIVVGRNGELRANVHASEVHIYGKIYGQVSADKKICIYSSGSILGDISAPEFEIEKGSVIIGRCNTHKIEKLNEKGLEMINTPQMVHIRT